MTHGCILTCLLFLIGKKFIKCDELFQSSIGDNMEIGLADGGYKSVKLKCGSNSMQIHLETEEDFSGVIYTRGSFHDKKPSCFLDPGYPIGKRTFMMKFDFDKCKTKQKGNVYSNVLVLQHDKELIMPGDAAFTLECDFGTPRDVTVNANLDGKPKPIVSRISLTEADPSKKTKRSKRSSIESETSTIEITPEKARLMTFAGTIKVF